MRYIPTPTLLITLAIVLAPLAPRIAGAAEGINFVTIVEIENEGLCYTDANTLVYLVKRFVTY